MNLIKKILNYLISKFRGKTIFKQELLLKKALVESGFSLNKLTIKCDHDLGINYVNGIQLGIKYPDSFFDKAVALTSEDKKIDFFFNGYINQSGGRWQLIKPFTRYPNVNIVSSKEGRDDKKKDWFNEDYFVQFSNAKFGLCPHQLDWPGSRKHLWTYRFIEACFAGSLPVLFEATPLSKKFIDGFTCLWDYEFENDYSSSIKKYDYNKVLANQSLAKKRFCLTKLEINKIAETL